MIDDNRIQCVRVKLKPGGLEAARAWAAEMRNRHPEVLEALRAEGMELEAVFCERLHKEDYLVYVIKAADIAHSQQISRMSQAPVEQLHRLFKKTYWESVTKLERLLALET